MVFPERDRSEIILDFKTVTMRKNHFIHIRTALIMSAIIGLVMGMNGIIALALADEEKSFITIENRSGKDARVAIPGGKTLRIKDGTKAYRAELVVTKRNGIDVKAWWSLEPRQLCVIFVRYEGHVVIGGKKLIKCLGV